MIYIPKEVLIKIIAEASLEYIDLDASDNGYVPSGYMIENGLKDLEINIDYLNIDDEIYEAMRD